MAEFVKAVVEIGQKHGDCPFYLTKVIEQAVVDYQNHLAQESAYTGELPRNTRKRLAIKRPTTEVVGHTKYKFLNCNFSLGVNKKRSLQIWIDQFDYPLEPGKRSILLSIGDWGDGEEIVRACATAVSSNHRYFLVNPDSSEPILKNIPSRIPPLGVNISEPLVVVKD